MCDVINPLTGLGMLSRMPLARDRAQNALQASAAAPTGDTGLSVGAAAVLPLVFGGGDVAPSIDTGGSDVGSLDF